MGINNNDYDDGVHDDEHLYSRRASAHTIYSTTASSGRSSPTFSSRRGSSSTTILNTAGTSSSTAARTRAYTLSRDDYNDDATVDNPSYRIPHTRATHPAALPAGQPLNYDGIIKHPSRYPYARSHHHHPYAHYSHHDMHNVRPPSSAGHPYYSQQKRHSFAALRTTASRPHTTNMATTMTAGGDPPLPLVRLPSIDQGLPPFLGDASGMILPIRRGSLTDPLLHAHNPSSSSSALAGPSGTSPFSHSLSPAHATGGPSHYKSGNFPYPASYESSSRRVSSDNVPAYNYPAPPPASVNTPPTPNSAPTKEALPFFKKTTKTLFPQQHGPSLSPALEAGSSLANAPTHSAVSGSTSVLGTKRKLEPLTEFDHGPGAEGDYFTPDAPGVGNIVRPPSSALSVNNPMHQEGGPSIPIAKRRASQHFINALGADAQGQLPTPATTAGLNSAGGTSAGSSERRTSNGSSEAGVPGSSLAASRLGAASHYTTSAPQYIIQEDAVPQHFDARYSRVTPRQLDQVSLSHQQDMEAEMKSEYAFPHSRPPGGDERLSPSMEMTSLNQDPNSNYYATQAPYSSRAYPPSSSATSTLQQIPPYAPPPGAPVSQEVRSRASTIFGSAAAGGRPSYTSNGVPVAPDSKLVPYSGQPSPGMPTYNGPSSSTKGGFSNGGPSALSAQQQQQIANASNLPYARSPALKVSHKIAERKRRKEMKELFDELRDCIPSMNSGGAGNTSITSNVDDVSESSPAAAPTFGASHPPDVGGRGIKSSKWEVLAKAVEYITKLQYENSELNNTVLELQRLNQAFQDELSLVKNGGAGSANIGGISEGAMQLRQDQQLYPPQQPHPQAASITYNGQTLPSAHPSPSPVSVHAMPPLAHHSHSMPAAIGGGTHSSLHSPHPTLHQSPLPGTASTPTIYPVSAPPHMASHSFFGPNDTGNTAQAFVNPNQRHFAMHNHSRNVSMGSNSGSVNGGTQGQGHFEHAGSAPPALQQHPHLQHPHHLQQQDPNGMNSPHQGSPLNNTQTATQIFSYQGAPGYDVQPQHPQQQQPRQHNGYNGYPTQQQSHLQRPGSLRSIHSNQSAMSGMSVGSHPHPSQSPVSQNIQMVQQQQDTTWGSAAPYSQQAPLIRNGTMPPGSAQATPMMSPLNTSY